jgi:catechol 2,3-dioxygenase-like lactoylglutathione lyase family enzyme
MTPQIDVITLGVTDLEQAREFYERGLGGAIRAGHEGLTVSVARNSSPLVLRGCDEVASDAGVEARSSGFRAFTLSFVVASADEVDQILERAARHGGRVSKPPENALWGYSAYVTDPDGYLWKVASTKRRPLLGRKQPSSSNGHPIEPQEVPITIGVAAMKQAKQFYKDGLGLPVKKAFGNKFVMFRGGDGASDLGVYQREALAVDAAVQPDGSGFHGFSITNLVDSADEVDAVVARAADAGATIVKPAAPGADGYSGTFADPDGNLWQVACRQPAVTLSQSVT